LSEADKINVACIGLGSNLGDRLVNIQSALKALQENTGIPGLVVSSIYETEPVGGPDDQGLFLNAVAKVETTLDAFSLLALMQQIENDLGRRRVEHWGPRTIDLDLLLFGNEVIETADLTVPHPRMHERMFVLAPLAEVAGEAVHPVLGKSIKELLADLSKV